MDQSSSDTVQRDTPESIESVTERGSRDASRSVTPDQSSMSDSAVGPQSNGPNTRGQYEQRYGIDIDTPGQADRLQRLEQSATLSQVQRWADEGIPIDAMGTPSKMQAFRQRKGTPVPWDIEQRNETSKRRNTSAVQRATRESPAGQAQVPDSVRDVVSAPGKPVDAALRKPVASKIGQSLDHARVHRSPAADAACDQLNARAFTVNNHVAVRSDQPSPDTPAGQHLLSHELTHVAQQTGGAVSLLPDTGTLEVDPDPQLEQEAEETAQRVMQGGDLGIQRLTDTDVHVQRTPDMGDAKMPAGLEEQVHKQGRDVDKRKQRLEGTDPDTQTRIKRAIRQVGGSCAFAAVQALLALHGRDTTSIANIIEQMPVDDSYDTIMKSKKVSPMSYTRRKDLCFDPPTTKYLQKVLDVVDREGIARRHEWGTKRNDPGAYIFDYSYMKRLLHGLGELYEDRQGNINPEEMESILDSDIGETSKEHPKYEDFRVGQNMVKYLQQAGKSGLFPSMRERVLNPDPNMNTLKAEFIHILDTLDTPALIGSKSFYREDTPGEPSLHQGSHVIVVYGMTVDDDGNVFVEVKDGNDDGPRRVALNKFLSPLNEKAVNDFNNEGRVWGKPAPPTSMSIRDTKNIDNEYLDDLSARPNTLEQGGQPSTLQKPTGTAGQRPDPPDWDSNALEQQLVDKGNKAATAGETLLKAWEGAIQFWDKQLQNQTSRGVHTSDSEFLGLKKFTEHFTQYPRINHDDILNDFKLIRPGNHISYWQYMHKLQEYEDSSRRRINPVKLGPVRSKLTRDPNAKPFK